jgi:hypothetical protein
MVQETETTAAPAEPFVAPSPVTEQESPTEATPAESPVEEVKDEEAAPTPEPVEYTTAEEWTTYSESDEFLHKSAYTAHHEEMADTAYKKGRSETQKRLQPLSQQTRDNSKSANDRLGALLTGLQQLVKSGDYDGESLNQMEKQSGGIQAYVEMQRSSNTLAGMRQAMRNIASSVDLSDVGDTHTGKLNSDGSQIVEPGRFDDYFSGAATLESIFGDFAEDLTAAVKEKATAPLKAEIAKLKAAAGVTGTKAMENKRPDSPTTTGGGARPTPQQYEKATSDQRREWRKNGIEPLTV